MKLEQALAEVRQVEVDQTAPVLCPLAAFRAARGAGCVEKTDGDDERRELVEGGESTDEGVTM